ncbi:MAG: HPF/RaiA family ribosome-associated protein, partial [Candidatus Pacebacteria bacterium]|nr:HPF/RaiA family ribosome-associated protein [Candidatus Paceibacterota bacterium]
ERKDGEVICEVEIGRTTKHHNSGDIFKAEINLTQPGSKQVYAMAEEVDLYTAIDVVRDEAERVIVSKKTKDSTLFRRGAAQVKNLLKRINFRKS